jgi:Mrp family chromosome partitioning ATPase
MSTSAYRLDAGSVRTLAPAFTSRTAIAAAELSTTVHVLAAGEVFCLSTHDVAKETVGSQLSAVGQAASTEKQPSTEASPPLRVHQTTTEKRPLSSFTNQGCEPSPLGVTPKSQHLQARTMRAGTSVTAFNWPNVCQVLSSQCVDQFQGAVDVLLAEADGGRSLVGVMALHAGQGCTTTLLCLARQLAAHNRRVIVLDANFATPQLAIRLGVELPTGSRDGRSPGGRAWQDILERGVPIADAVVHSKADRIDLLPLDDRPTNGPRLAAGLQPAITAGVLLDAYDLVLVDLGAILEPLSQASILELVRNMRMDAAVVVGGPRRIEPREIDLVGQLLGQRGCKLLGTIENFVSGMAVAET